MVTIAHAMRQRSTTTVPAWKSIKPGGEPLPIDCTTPTAPQIVSQPLTESTKTDTTRAANAPRSREC